MLSSSGGSGARISSRRRINVESKTKPESVKVDYPPGKAVKDTTLKLDCHVYEDKAEIKVSETTAKRVFGTCD